MTALSADQFPGAEHQPLAYPGLRPKFSYVYYQGKVYKVMCRGKSYADLWLEDTTGEVPLDTFLAARGNATMARRHAVLAVGSNGCPGRLAEKYANQPDVAFPVLAGTLADTAVVYSSRLVSYGALPATYLRQPDALSWLSVTMLTDDQLALMDKTEHIGQTYQRIPVPGQFRTDGGQMIGDLTGYLNHQILTYRNKPVLLKLFARASPDWPIMDEPGVLSLIFNQAGLLLGEPIETRHRHLLKDKALRRKLTEFLKTNMSELTVDKKGQLATT